MKVVCNPGSVEDKKYSLFDDKDKRITTTSLDNCKKILRKSYPDAEVTGLPGKETAPVVEKLVAPKKEEQPAVIKPAAPVRVPRAAPGRKK